MGRKKQPGVPYIKTEQGCPYYYVTYAKGKRMTLHRLTWTRANGPVPAGHVIRFRDGNTLNCELSNLYTAPRSQFTLENAKRDITTPKLVARNRLNGARRGASIKRAYAEGRIDITTKTAKSSATKMDGLASDSYYANTLFGMRNPKMAALVLAECPELVEAQREKLKLINHLKRQAQ